MTSLIERAIVPALLHRLRSGTPLVQILVGPRQTGKTTAARQVARQWSGPVRIAAADSPIPPGPEWVETHWLLARRELADEGGLLVLDEIQKVQGWGESVKALWDEDRAAGRRLSVLLLGSSSLHVTRGSKESLAGRFFLHRCTHWSWPECRAAFGWSLERWLVFGGYPGAAPLADESPDVWRTYVVDSLIEAVLARDVLGLSTVAKPALLRHLFVLAARFPAQVLSYTKMLGQLQDAGNTTTLAHYLRLLDTAFLVTGLERYSAGAARSRGSSPKLVLRNNALVTALGERSPEVARQDPAWWGRLVENAVGSHLLNGLPGLSSTVTYWRERSDEVDFVVETGDAVWALEVKSGRPGRPARGLEAFRRRWPHTRALVIGSGGMDLDEFFSTPPDELLRSRL